MTWHKRDKIMTKLVKSLPVPESRAKDDLYLALLDSVMGQQLSTRVADVIFERFLALFKDNYPDAKKLLKMPDEKLRAAGLSGAKVKYAKNIAEFHLQHPITQERLAHLSDDDILTELTSIKGVGPWTVQMLLMFAMDRPDVFSVGDLVIRQMMIQHYNVTETGKAQLNRLQEIAEGWRPNRTLACRYLWNARDVEKQNASLLKTRKTK
jgi:DNA-3-methyladenine glycosylase II